MLQNSDLKHCQDLGSLLTFLQIYRPLDDENFFKRVLLRPLKDGDPSGAELLRVSYCALESNNLQIPLSGPDEWHLHPPHKRSRDLLLYHKAIHRQF